MAKQPKPDIERATIGRTSATERQPTTSDDFSFWLGPDVIVNPFDIVEVEQTVPKSKTYGLITTIDHYTDAANHLSNFISSDFGNVGDEPNTPRVGASIAHANILSNTSDVYMPVTTGCEVRFADAEGIYRALGIDELMKSRPRDAVPAGLVRLSSGATATAFLDSRYLLGPESAHVNISGISGLATKTSFAMFLLQSILQRTEHPEKIAIIILNVKHGDLLAIDKPPDQPLSVEQKELWESLGLKPEHFKSVKYFLPRGKFKGRPNSHFVPDQYQTYAYDLQATVENLDSLFSQVPDAYATLESIIAEIKEGFRNNEKDFRNVQSFTNLLNGPPLYDNGAAVKGGWRGIAASSINVFKRHMRRMIFTGTSGLFTDARATHERVISEQFRKIKGGNAYVVDIALLHDFEQALVFGDLLRTVYEIKAEGAEDEKGNVIEPPEKVIFFVDELNKYAPRGRAGSSITSHVLEISERGRSLGVILIAAQQFMSAVHERVTGNSATKVLGRTGAAEVGQSDYRFLDDDIKMNLTRLTKGELLISHAIYRQPVRIIFPMPAYKQPTE
jgi:DNA helicase HerA-like ATPase